jgi:hypothetical protein
LPPFSEASGVLAIAAARDLLIPFFLRPSYCLSSWMLGPWSFALLPPLGFAQLDTRSARLSHEVAEQEGPHVLGRG